MSKYLSWLKTFHAELQKRFQLADTSYERQQVLYTLVDINERLSKILERDTGE